MSDERVQIRAVMSEGDDGEIRVMLSTDNAVVRVKYTSKRELVAIFKNFPGAMEKLLDGYAAELAEDIPDTIPWD